MHNELFHIGNITIYGYGLMIAIGILGAIFMADLRAKKKGLSSDNMFWMACIAAASGMVGAKLMYYITVLPEIIKDPSLLSNMQNGWVVYGGIIAGVLSCWIFCKVKKVRFSEYIDLAAPSVALAQGFGRIGCLLAGCCYGIQTDGACSITFHNSAYAPNGVALFPSQPVSSILNFLNCIILLIFARKNKKGGRVIGLYMLLYSVGRFIIEYYRGDLERGSVGIFSTSQFISIFIFAAAVLILWFGLEWMDSKKAVGPEAAEASEEECKEASAEGNEVQESEMEETGAPADGGDDGADGE